MSSRNVFTLTALLTIILALTVIIGGRGAQPGPPKPPSLGWLAPVLILTLMTWYLIMLLSNRKEIIAGVAGVFKLGGPREFVRTNFWATLAAYTLILLLGIVILWVGIPQRILGRIQELSSTQISAPAQANPTTGVAPPTAIVYLGGLLLAAIFITSFILLTAGIRLALSKREIQADEPRLGIKEEATEVVRQTITALKSERRNEYHEMILQCYQKMCDILSKVGTEVSPTDTAREFAQNISSELHVDSNGVNGLTFLFEEARYSRHEISEEKRKMALDYLASLQLALSSPGMNA